jgi:hypothetical protein
MEYYFFHNMDIARISLHGIMKLQTRFYMFEAKVSTKKKTITQVQHKK